jgi:hypothetical protein
MSILALQTMRPNEFEPVEGFKSWISSISYCCNGG